MGTHDHEAEILIAIIAELDTWGHALQSDRPQHKWARMFYADNPAEQLQRWGVPNHAEIFAIGKELTQADRMSFSRSIRRLAGLRLILPIRRHNSRVSHLQITPRGLELGVRLLRQNGAEPDLENITTALKATRWATPEHLSTLETLKEASV
jgi:hypothetical protein